MPTYGATMLAELGSAEAALLRLTHDAYTPGDVRDIISAVGAKTEIFLKSVALPGHSSRNTFEWFIDHLPATAIDTSGSASLHSLRRAYNAVKHDPAFPVELLASVQLVRGTMTSVQQIVSSAVGSVNQPMNAHFSRVFWIAVWDHFVHGDSEVHIIIPGTSECWLGPPTFDLVYVSIAAWRQIKIDLAAIGSFKNGRGLIPQAQYDAFRSDSDFLGAWVFEGDYRGLIATLATHEMRQELLAGLNRTDESGRMIVAYLLATVDAAVGSVDLATLAADIRQKALGYAVPLDYPHAAYLSEGMATMLAFLQPSDWKTIAGPAFVRRPQYDGLVATSLAKHPKYDIIIDEDFVVRMLWEHT